MRQKELYIKYLEDALNYAKTGEPMKKWQWRWKNDDSTSFSDLGGQSILLKIERIDLRIKPEPFKWTTFAFKPKDCPTVYHASHNGHMLKENICEKLRISLDELLAVHHHEIEIE